MIYQIKTNNLYRSIFAFACIFTICFLSGCSSSTSSPDQATLTTSTEMSNNRVSATHMKSGSVTGGGLTCDSVVISRARILISTIKLHIDENDTAGKGTIKAGPFIAEFTPSAENILSTVTIPPGTYDKMKFEIHKLDDKSDASLINSPVFGDFVNGGRYTAIIDGKAYVNGIGYDFSFKSSRSDNVEIKLNPPVSFSAGSSYNLALIFDPVLVFGQTGSRPLDPRSTDNHNEIEELIKDALKALKK
jgi:hypothetical protein